MPTPKVHPTEEELLEELVSELADKFGGDEKVNTNARAIEALRRLVGFWYERRLLHSGPREDV